MNTVVSGGAQIASSAAWKIAGSGFSAPTQWLSAMTANSGANPALLTHRFEVAVEIRYDAEPIALSQRLQDRAIASEGRRGFRQESRRHAPMATIEGSGAVIARAAARQFSLEIGGQSLDRFRQSCRARQAPDEGTIGGIEGGRECIGAHVQPFGSVETVEAVLPGHAVGVERTAKVEQQRLDWPRRRARLRLRAHYERPGRTTTLSSRAASSGRSKPRPSMKALQASRATLSRNCRGGLFI